MPCLVMVFCYFWFIMLYIIAFMWMMVGYHRALHKFQHPLNGERDYLESSLCVYVLYVRLWVCVYTLQCPICSILLLAVTVIVDSSVYYAIRVSISWHHISKLYIQWIVSLRNNNLFNCSWGIYFEIEFKRILYYRLWWVHPNK